MAVEETREHRNQNDGRVDYTKALYQVWLKEYTQRGIIQGGEALHIWSSGLLLARDRQTIRKTVQSFREQSLWSSFRRPSLQTLKAYSAPWWLQLGYRTANSFPTTLDQNDLVRVSSPYPVVLSKLP